MAQHDYKVTQPAVVCSGAVGEPNGYTRRHHSNVLRGSAGVRAGKTTTKTEKTATKTGKTTTKTEKTAAKTEKTAAKTDPRASPDRERVAGRAGRPRSGSGPLRLYQRVC